MPKTPQASSWTDLRNALSGSSNLTDTRCMETVELEVRSGLGTGNGGLSEGQLSITATRSPEAKMKSETSSALASACSLKGASAPPTQGKSKKPRP